MSAKNNKNQCLECIKLQKQIEIEENMKYNFWAFIIEKNLIKDILEYQKKVIFTSKEGRIKVMNYFKDRLFNNSNKSI